MAILRSYPEPGAANHPRARVRRRLWTCSEIAKLCGVTSETVRQWIRSGELQAQRIGKQGTWHRVTAQALEDAARAGTNAALTAGWLTRLKQRNPTGG